MVVPVPCKLALLLKLLTKISPLTRSPLLCCTTATPYGLISPLLGTVEAIILFVFSDPRNELPAANTGVAVATKTIVKANTAILPNKFFISSTLCLYSLKRAPFQLLKMLSLPEVQRWLLDETYAK